ncbi:MAG: hypothetical protein COZ16_04875 [Flavobacteriaceae bacterium CG_4_10_14_3_um_filter_31_253]|nr:MAG: hypothetical protein COW43_10705 [Flavobacteriaceae bacterium CG17_big_fil_post_rev_8_21_14_2_50_31_13]PIX13305.1 MAG: hypothetical protein COZ74_06975 [Flavobacteriaceae bacterium CG_4_8_14_3_um_filter_31_8]PIY15298.1 MAG: hypothetical protein COZ16_04875 [Flavobacteriaceae bacterium CG_4_10_14_3_um_filter_31_253]PIZ09666.1 MAG: hypothetical protein COY55_11675 [Flavobacteriaceae bacterium CG_4_10_14_0_8_um_filter_31_99]PJC10068.1 MAG: hypothetical protein CO067_06610 [Flavobacteriacea
MKKELRAVHNDELIELLDRLELLDKLKNGELKCKFTDTIITLENLHSIFPESGSIKLVCNSPEAIKNLSEYVNEHNL